MALFVPCGMAVVAEDEFGTDAVYFAGSLRRLRVAEVAEELDGSVEALGGHGIGCAARFKFEHIENLAAGGKEPAERIGHGEGHTLALTVIDRKSTRLNS